MTDIPQNLDTILHIGAGRCEELPAYLASDAKNILLVEPNPKLAAQLRQRTQSEPRVQVLEKAITDDPALTQLNEYNLPEAASLYQPTGLRQIFPGLRVISSHAVTTKTPEQLLEEHPLKGEDNLLVLQAPAVELAILRALADAEQLGHISHIWLTNPHDAYYEAGSRAEDTLAELQSLGYEIKAEQQSNSDWPQWRLACNPMVRKLDALTEEKQALSDALQQRQNELERTRLESAEHTEQLNKAQAVQKRLESEINELREELKQIKGQLNGKLVEAREAKNKELQEANTKRLEAEKRTEKLTAKVKKLEERLASEQNGQKQFNELKQRMEYLFGQQSLQLEQAANALGRHVTTTTKSTARELEAGLQLQQQYGAELVSLEEQGSRLPSSVALQLSRQLKTRPYDLIIEMGSGVTTSFLAQTLRKQSRAPDGEEANGNSVARYVEPSDDDLPKRIVCFEHSRANVNALQQNLKQSGLSPLINLHYAPLVPYQHQGREYLYYDCGNRLRQIAQLFENRTARVFILLNDVAGESRPDSIAALPQLLQYLSAHALDIVISTADADANLINQWQQLLEERGLEYEPAISFGSSTAQFMRINPRTNRLT